MLARQGLFAEELFLDWCVLRANSKQNNNKKKLQTQCHFCPFCPRSSLHFVRIISCVSRPEDGLAPDLSWSDILHVKGLLLPTSVWKPHYSSQSLTSSHTGSGREARDRKSGWVCTCEVGLGKAPSPPVHTKLSSRNHSLQETWYQLIWKTRLTHFS